MIHWEPSVNAYFTRQADKWKFIQDYCKRWGWTINEYQRLFDTRRRPCKKEGCESWIPVYRDKTKTPS